MSRNILDRYDQEEGIFTLNNNARWGNHEGPQEVRLAVSRDLFHWERPFRTPVIPWNLVYGGEI